MSAIDIDRALRAAMARRDPPDTQEARAAVAIIVADHPPKILFIKRAVDLRDPWSGHVALPGGRRDPADTDIEHTARRETREEVGIELSDRHFWGVLEPVMARSRANVSQMWVVPHVYRIEHAPPSLILNHREAETARWIDVETLVHPETASEIELKHRENIMKFPAWVVGDFTIWGLTYLVVRRLLDPLFTTT